jgi:hypothetical protein
MITSRTLTSSGSENAAASCRRGASCAEADPITAASAMTVEVVTFDSVIIVTAR